MLATSLFAPPVLSANFDDLTLLQWMEQVDGSRLRCGPNRKFLCPDARPGQSYYDLQSALGVIPYPREMLDAFAAAPLNSNSELRPVPDWVPGVLPVKALVVTGVG